MLLWKNINKFRIFHKSLSRELHTTQTDCELVDSLNENNLFYTGF